MVDVNALLIFLLNLLAVLLAHIAGLMFSLVLLIEIGWRLSSMLKGGPSEKI